MDSEPGSRSMNVSLWGYRNDYTKWVVITIDFRKLLSRDCEYSWRNTPVMLDYNAWGQVCFSSEASVAVQAMKGTMKSGWLTLQTPVAWMMAAWWASERPSYAWGKIQCAGMEETSPLPRSTCLVRAQQQITIGLSFSPVTASVKLKCTKLILSFDIEYSCKK